MNVALSLGLAVLCGTVIGIERQWRHKRAGITTNTLVALGSSGFAMLSAHGFGPSSNPAQLASAVITGIGFIGAGVIIHRGSSVQGVNTAATLWANASMGVAMGSGNYEVGLMIFAAIMTVLLLTRPFAMYISRRAGHDSQPEIYELKVTCDPGAIESIDRTWKTFADKAGIVPTKRAVSPGAWAIAFTSRPERMLSIPALETALMSLPGVTQVTTQRDEMEEGDPF